MNAKRPGLTYGKLMLLMLGFIALAVGAAWVRQTFFLGPALGYDDVPLAVVRDAAYDLTQTDSAALDRLKGVTQKSTGTLLFVRTNAGNVAKLSVSFQKCLLDPQNIKFWVHRGTVYDADGRVVQTLDEHCVDLTARYDLDTGAQGAPDELGEAADLAFVYRSVGLQLVQAVNGAALSLPGTTEALRAP